MKALICSFLITAAIATSAAAEAPAAPDVFERAARDLQARVPADTLQISAFVAFDGKPAEMIPIGTIARVSGERSKPHVFELADLQLQVTATVLEFQKKYAVLKIEAASGSRYLEAKGLSDAGQNKLFSAAHVGQVNVSRSRAAILLDWRQEITSADRSGRTAERREGLVIVAVLK